jgi:hypothetical protein
MFPYRSLAEVIHRLLLWIVILLFVSPVSLQIAADVSTNIRNDTSNLISARSLRVSVVNSDRGAFAKLERLKSRLPSSSTDIKTIESNELVQLVKKGVYNKKIASSTNASPIHPGRQFLQQLYRVEYEGNDRCLVSSSNSIDLLRVVLFVDSPYFRVFQNWLIFFISVCGRQPFISNRKLESTKEIDLNSTSVTLEIVCLDVEVEALVNSSALRCSKYSSKLQDISRTGASRNNHIADPNADREIEEQAYRGALWVQRMNIVYEMVTIDKWNIILSDLDALWIHDPISDIDVHFQSLTLPHYDLVTIASQGEWPQEVSQRWGSAICMGLIMFPAHASTGKLIKRVLSNWNVEKKDHALRLGQIESSLSKGWVDWDDQYAINTALATNRISWTAVDQNHSRKKAMKEDRKAVVQPPNFWSWLWSTHDKQTNAPSVVAVPINDPLVDYRGEFSFDDTLKISSIILLAQNAFVRECLLFSHHGNITEKVQNRMHVGHLMNQDEIKVLHCRGGMRTSGSANRKIRFLKELGLWRLEE